MKIISAKKFDRSLAILIMAISLFGCLMVYSSSSYYADQTLNDSLFYFKRQLLWLLIAVVGGVLAYLTGYRRLTAISPYLLAISIAMLIMVLFLEPIRNVHRWIRLGPLNFQPSEMARIVLVLFFASAVSRVADRIERREVFAALVAVALVVCGLIIVEPDIGNTLALSASLGFVLYIAGCKRRHLLTTAAIGLTAICIMVFGFGYQQDRMLGYLAGLQSPFDSPYQVKQSLMAIGTGGFIGTGWGGGGQKLLFLPEPYSDFIYASIAEETGMLMTVPLITAYLAIFYLGCKIAVRCTDMTGKLVAFGLSAMISVSGFINIGVALGVLPVTGLPLPFVSYGGSSLLFNMIAVGLIISVAKTDRPTFAGAVGYGRKRAWPGRFFPKGFSKRSNRSARLR